MGDWTANESARNNCPPASPKGADFSGCRGGCVVPNYLHKEILIRYASRLAKNVAHGSAKVRGLNLLPYDIGIDVATLALKKIVERIILFSGDTDMIPALKLARREGLQVYVVKLDPWPLKHSIIEDSDGVRVLTPSV